MKTNTNTDKRVTTPAPFQAGRLVNHGWARTKYLRANDHHGARMLAQAVKGDVDRVVRVTLPFDYSLSMHGNHQAAAHAVLRKAGLSDDLGALVVCTMVHPKVGHHDWSALVHQPAFAWSIVEEGEDRHLEVTEHGEVTARFRMLGEDVREEVDSHCRDLALHLAGGHAGLEFWDARAEERHVVAVRNLCDILGVKGGAL